MRYGLQHTTFRLNATVRNGAYMGAAALVALWDGYSRGTKNMIETAKRKGLRVFIYRFEE